MITTRKFCYRVRMTSGPLFTKEVWCSTAFNVGTMVKDNSGRLFRVIECEEIEYPGISLTQLWKV